MYEAIPSRDVPAPADSSESQSRFQSLRLTRSGLQRSSFDQEYVNRLRDGDPATEQHFTAYFGELLLIKLRARLRHAQAIDDVRQETFVRVLTAIKTKKCLQCPERLGAFVNSVSENVLLELYRKNSLHRVVELDERHDPPDRRRSAESEMVTEERRQQVRNVLAELPAKDRDLLRMIFYEDVEADEICRSFRVDRNYLRVLVHRAKARFRECLLKRYAEAGQAHA
jgi:RNA polymerase sigma-70 factor (ECF subfamily)